jgi:hypothetical protein
MDMNGRTIWIVDADYLLKASPGRFDYLKHKKSLEQENGHAFSENYYLNSSPNPSADAQDAFHTWLDDIWDAIKKEDN